MNRALWVNLNTIVDSGERKKLTQILAELRLRTNTCVANPRATPSVSITDPQKVYKMRFTNSLYPHLFFVSYTHKKRMRWKNLFGAAGFIVLISAFRLQDKYVFENTQGRDAFVKSQEDKK